MSLPLSLYYVITIGNSISTKGLTLSKNCVQWRRWWFVKLVGPFFQKTSFRGTVSLYVNPNFIHCNLSPETNLCAYVILSYVQHSHDFYNINGAPTTVWIDSIIWILENPSWLREDYLYVIPLWSTKMILLYYGNAIAIFLAQVFQKKQRKANFLKKLSRNIFSRLWSWQGLGQSLVILRKYTKGALISRRKLLESTIVVLLVLLAGKFSSPLCFPLISFLHATMKTKSTWQDSMLDKPVQEIGRIRTEKTVWQVTGP